MQLIIFLFTGCEYVGTKLETEEHTNNCKHKNSADTTKCQALHSGVLKFVCIVKFSSILI